MYLNRITSPNKVLRDFSETHQTFLGFNVEITHIKILAKLVHGIDTSASILFGQAACGSLKPSLASLCKCLA